MSIVRFGLMTLALAVLFADPSSAQNNGAVQPPPVDPQRLMFDNDNRFSMFRSKQPDQMMSEADYKTYEQALAELDCGSANKILNRAFIRQYPQFERARLIPKCRNNRDCLQWENYASVTFREYGQCGALSQLNEAERELRQREITPPKFRLKWWREPTVYNTYLIEKRDRALGMLIGSAIFNYIPALIKLADLVRRGDVFNAGREVEYYILRRACLFGDNCTTLAERLAKLRNGLATDRIEAIDRQSSVSPKTRPILHYLLLGEKTLK